MIINSGDDDDDVVDGDDFDDNSKDWQLLHDQLLTFHRINHSHFMNDFNPKGLR